MLCMCMKMKKKGQVVVLALAVSASSHAHSRIHLLRGRKVKSEAVIHAICNFLCCFNIFCCVKTAPSASLIDDAKK